ncbi:MAG: SAM-dependent methyltransferase [Clostridia bacterium]|nr:SAM-dependent methyltransferase [Clostridia bacterium]
MTKQQPVYPVLRARLSAVRDAVRKGSVVADVGTDHAHLPIALCLSKIAPRVIASDVRDGPIASARENVRAYGLSDRITVLKTDGLRGIEAYDPDDVLISGMGGELIVRILSEAAFIKQNGKRLVLQPQTHPELVRAFLAENGFGIVAEAVAQDDGDRLYQIITAEYDGIVRPHDGSPEACCARLIGAQGMGQDASLYRALAAHHSAVLARRIAGKRSAERPTEKDGTDGDEALLAVLGRYTG